MSLYTGLTVFQSQIKYCFVHCDHRVDIVVAVAVVVVPVDVDFVIVVSVFITIPCHERMK